MTLPSRRAELIAFAAFCLANLLVPLFIVDLFPFSRAPMFADAPRRYCNFRLLDPDGKPLDNRDFGVQRNYWGNPIGVGCGFRPPETLDRFGEVPSREDVVAHIAERIASHPELPFVDVERETIGPTDANAVGITEWTRWRVPNPHPAGGPAR